MVKIRLARFGKRNQPIYRVVVMDSRKKRDGKNIEVLGSYNPNVEPMKVKIDKDRYSYWIGCGAQPSKTVSALFKKA